MCRKPLLIIYIFLSLTFYAGAQNQRYCDSIIEEGINAMWKKDYLKSLELLTKGRAIAEKNLWYKQQFMAVNNIGANYYNMIDYGSALNFYLEAYNIALKKLDTKYELLALNNIAILYSKEKNYDKAKEYFEKAYTSAKEINDYKNLGTYALNLGYLCNETGKYDRGRQYIIESMKYLKNRPEDHTLILSELALAENDLLQGNTLAARQRAEKQYKDKRAHQHEEILIGLHTVISRSYLAEKKYKEAIDEATRGNKTNPDLDGRQGLLELLAEIYTKQGSFEMALRYKDSIIENQKKLNDIKNGRIFESNRVKFELLNYRQEIENNQEKLKMERVLFYSSLAVVSVVVTLIVLMFRQKKIMAEKDRQILTLELETEKDEKYKLEKQVDEAHIVQEKLHDEIETRNRKLSAKALYFSGRNELIEEIVSYLSKKPKFAKDVTLGIYLESLRNYSKIDNEWDDFMAHFEEVNHGFLTKLKAKHPVLSSNDIRFIAYVYMNLSTKEIANIFNITLVAARKRKERIAVKMEIPKDVDLYYYISGV